jgi:hypothetical protein
LSLPIEGRGSHGDEEGDEEDFDLVWDGVVNEEEEAEREGNDEDEVFVEGAGEW